jgi:hypothetical protein
MGELCASLSTGTDSDDDQTLAKAESKKCPRRTHMDLLPLNATKMTKAREKGISKPKSISSPVGRRGQFPVGLEVGNSCQYSRRFKQTNVEPSFLKSYKGAIPGRKPDGGAVCLSITKVICRSNNVKFKS